MTLRVNICKNHPYWNLVGQQIDSGPLFSNSSSKIGFLANFQLKRTYLDQNFWTHRSTSKMEKNDPKKIIFPICPKSSPNHIKLSVDIRNDVFNWFRVLLVLDSFRSFGYLKDEFRACFSPKVKNLTCSIRLDWNIVLYNFHAKNKRGNSCFKIF